MNKLILFMLFLLLLGLRQSANSQIMYDAKTSPRPKFKTDLILKNNEKKQGTLLEINNNYLIIASEYLYNSNIKYFTNIDTIPLEEVQYFEISEIGDFIKGALYGALTAAIFITVGVGVIYIFASNTLGNSILGTLFSWVVSGSQVGALIGGIFYGINPTILYQTSEFYKQPLNLNKIKPFTYEERVKRFREKYRYSSIN
jgi:hypothetical protein